MTEQQRQGIEILNRIRADVKDDGTPVISEDDYFHLLSFIIDRHQETQYVTQIVPAPYPSPILPYYDCQRWETTCK